MSNTPLSNKGEKTVSTNSTGDTSVENSAMVSSSTRASGGLSSKDSSTTKPCVNATRADATGSTSTDRLAHLRQSYASRRTSLQSTNLMLASWKDKTNPNYGSSFSKWASWYKQRGRDPLTRSVEDVVNFLAELYSEDYKYQSLNSYRSAISSTHEHVDRASMGSYPTVTRLLQGVFNNRPPQPRYNPFWDVGMVIQHIKDLGANKDLNLKQLTLKTVMLLDHHAQLICLS